MTPFEVEAWALRIIDQIKAGARVEDSRVELKSDWPDPKQGARRIAAHANAARGAPILWLIGVDEIKGAVGVKREELANWFPSVSSNFEGEVPEYLDVNIIENKVTVVALLFYTERAPFVVKNPVFGNKDGGPVELEVPWREGGKIRTARRTDLIRLLEPLTHLPKLETLEATVTVAQNRWFVDMSYYIAPSHGENTVFPFHKCSLSLSAGNVKISNWDIFRLEPPTRILRILGSASGPTTETDSLTVLSTGAELIVTGPGRVLLHAQASTSDQGVGIKESSLRLVVRLFPVGANMPIVIAEELSPEPFLEGVGGDMHWVLKG
jgi:hypothetical protein